MLRLSTLLVAGAISANAQSLYDAISKIPELSNFTEFYNNNQAVASVLFNNQANYPITFLAPSNKAFADYQARTGTPLADVPAEKLLELVQYHTLVSNLSLGGSGDAGASGLTVPTFLTNTEFNNRSVGVSMASKFGGTARASGQVVFIRSAESGGSKKRFVLSRQEGGAQSSIRSGLSSNVNLTVVNDEQGLWVGGRFHIVDGLLTPPTLCKTTIREATLTNLDRALNRTGLWDALDTSKNVTCLGPNDKAFADAGSPDSKLNQTALSNAILFHTLPEVAYSDYLENGQEFKSLQNGTVRVKIEGTGKDRKIWFNNAKVVDANVLTHNGLMHVLDAVMIPLEQMNATSSATPSSTPSATATGTGSASSSAAAKGAAVSIHTGSWSLSLWALAGATVVVLEMLGAGWLVIR